MNKNIEVDFEKLREMCLVSKMKVSDTIDYGHKEVSLIDSFIILKNSEYLLPNKNLFTNKDFINELKNLIHRAAEEGTLEIEDFVLGVSLDDNLYEITILINIMLDVIEYKTESSLARKFKILLYKYYDKYIDNYGKKIIDLDDFFVDMAISRESHKNSCLRLFMTYFHNRYENGVKQLRQSKQISGSFRCVTIKDWDPHNIPNDNVKKNSINGLSFCANFNIIHDRYSEKLDKVNERFLAVEDIFKMLNINIPTDMFSKDCKIYLKKLQNTIENIGYLDVNTEFFNAPIMFYHMLADGNDALPLGKLPWDLFDELDKDQVLQPIFEVLDEESLEKLNEHIFRLEYYLIDAVLNYLLVIIKHSEYYKTIFNKETYKAKLNLNFKELGKLKDELYSETNILESNVEKINEKICDSKNKDYESLSKDTKEELTELQNELEYLKEVHSKYKKMKYELKGGIC